MDERDLSMVINPSGELVERAWAGGGPGQRRAVFWDRPFGQRAGCFQKAMMESAASLVCRAAGYPVCASWAVRETGQTASIHFYACGQTPWLIEFGQAALAHYSRHFKCVTCLVPALFFGCRSLLGKLDFSQGPRFYKACEVNGRARDLVLYWRDFMKKPAVNETGIRIIYGEEKL